MNLIMTSLLGPFGLLRTWFATSCLFDAAIGIMDLNLLVRIFQQFFANVFVDGFKDLVFDGLRKAVVWVIRLLDEPVQQPCKVFLLLNSVKTV